jgi:hypothetical protein
MLDAVASVTFVGTLLTRAARLTEASFKVSTPTRPPALRLAVWRLDRL